MPRRSARSTKGVPPKYLNQFDMSSNDKQESGSDSGSDLNVTVKPPNTDAVYQLLAKLSSQLNEMKSELVATRAEQQAESIAREELSRKVMQLMSNQQQPNNGTSATESVMTETSSASEPRLSEPLSNTSTVSATNINGAAYAKTLETLSLAAPVVPIPLSVNESRSISHDVLSHMNPNSHLKVMPYEPYSLNSNQPDTSMKQVHFTSTIGGASCQPPKNHCCSTSTYSTDMPMNKSMAFDPLQSVLHHGTTTTHQPQPSYYPFGLSQNVTSVSAPTILSTSHGSLHYPQSPIQSSNNLNPNQIVASTHHEYQRKLYDLPNFEGRAEQWPSFISYYRSSSAAYGYSDLENMFRLQRCLKGEAKVAVESLMIFPENVNDVINQLEFLFGRPECLIKSQLQVVRGIPKIDDAHLDQIIPFAVKIRNLATFLETTNSQQHLANPILIEEVMSKIPVTMQLEWVQSSSSIVPYATIKDFSNWISVKAKYVSQITIPKVQNITRKFTQEVQYKTSNKKNVILHVNDNKIEKSVVNGVKCNLCGESHVITDCKRFKTMNVSERWEHVKAKRMCFSCLKLGHSSFQCHRKRNCGIDKCSRIHHQLLHEQMQKPNINQPSESSATEPIVSNAVLSCQNPTTSDIKPAKVLFKILPIKLFGPKKMVTTFALLDEGSSVTLMDECLARELELNASSVENLTLQWFSDVTSTQLSSILNVEIAGMDDASEKVQLCNVRTIKDLDLPVQTLALDKLHTRFHHLKRLPIYDYSNVKPSILIGINNCHVGLPSKIIQSSSNEPVAIKTKLGWLIYGPNISYESNGLHNQVLCVHQGNSMDILHETVKEYFTTENFGVQKVDSVLESKSDIRAREILKATTRKQDDKYETGLLWRLNEFEFPDSLPMAIRRLQLVEAKMRKDPEYGKKYREIIESYLLKGYARKLSPSEAARISHRTWFLPHFGIQNPAKPDKMRLVFDAAAEVNKVSLNSMLLTGPDQNSSLLSVLYKFRLGRIAVCADIMEMFHQVNIRPEDQDAQRFVWRDGDAQKQPEIYVMRAMIFGSKSSPCSAQYVMKFNARQFEHTKPRAVQSILEKHYVDDYAESFDCVEEAMEIVRDVTYIHKAGGFTLRNFMSNSKSVLQAINQSSSENLVNMNMHSDGKPDKILGLKWNTETDEFKFELKFHRVNKEIIDCVRKPTKRELLSIVMSIFDPFGLLANFVVFAKLMLQELWRSGIGWDEGIPDSIYDKWVGWQNELKNVHQFHIPRCISSNLLSAEEVQLHIFVDSSESAFAAVAYLRIASHNDVHVSFCSGKTKCAPQKILSVPRLELQASILGVRLKNSIVESMQMNVSKFYFWTDSMTVLHWIRSESRKYKPFVAHRVAEILESTVMVDWRWVPTDLNVADDATRAISVPKLNSECRWITGPEFLKSEESRWPIESNLVVDDESKEELRPKYQRILNVREIDSDNIFKWERYHNYVKLKRVAAWMIRFIFNCRATIARTEKRVKGLLLKELNSAELWVCRLAQMESYPDEYKILRNKMCTLDVGQNNLIDRSSKIYQLSPCMSEDYVIRIEGRIINATCIPLAARQPIILSKDHLLTEMIANYYHSLYRHQNQELIICEMRRKFWVPHIRVLIKKVKRKCLICKFNSTQPQTPVMGQLPVDRLSPFVRPFTYTGLDFFGPLTVSIGRRREKRWVALFSCLSIRAVHVEIAADLSTDACLLCIRNFVNRRGIPMRIRSDNGTNFVGCDNELKCVDDFFDHNAIQEELSCRNIEWVFNCPSNPHAGGCWERQVQMVKKVIKQCLVEVAPSVETLRSFLIEAENIVNSRPLTHVPVMPDSEEPLTPNHFLLGSANSTQTPGPYEERLLCSKKQWRVLQQLKNHFWRRWMSEFLPILTRRSKWFDKVDPLEIDDLVLICDADLPRSKWLRGRVVQVMPGKDRQVRVCEVKTATGILRRPASKLAKLDVKSCSKSTDLRGPGCHESFDAAV